MQPARAQQSFGSGSYSTYDVLMRSVDDLRPNPRNTRIHSKRKINDLANAIKAVGFIGVIIIDETGVIWLAMPDTPRRKLSG